MGRPEQTAALISEGLGPAEIAKRFRISTASVIQYVYVAIGEGRIRRSDVLFSLDKKLRHAVENIFRDSFMPPKFKNNPKAVQFALESCLNLKFDIDELKLYM